MTPSSTVHENKPCKWGFKYWVIADSSGYTGDFDLYAGKTAEKSSHELAFDVVLRLCRPFTYQGYQLFVDNYFQGATESWNCGHRYPTCVTKRDIRFCGSDENGIGEKRCSLWCGILH